MITIKTIGGRVIIEGDFDSIYSAILAAIKEGKDLRYANLRYANLSYADLSSANLSYADLSYANLSYADLSYADLSYADLRYANLSYANLRYADLSSADLSYANLSYADLSYADLRYANLSYANLRYADLSSAKNSELAIAQTRILPEGDIIGWKLCNNGVIAKLQIPSDAKRSHAFGRKCRAEFVKVLEIHGGEIGVTDSHGPKTEYRTGEIVRPNKWCENWQEECSNGIHFFITRAEAEAYIG